MNISQTIVVADYLMEIYSFLVDFEFQFNFVYFARHNENSEFADAKDNRLVINFWTLLYENVLTAHVVSLLCHIFLICFHHFCSYTPNYHKAFFLLSLKRNDIRRCPLKLTMRLKTNKVRVLLVVNKLTKFR